MVAKSSRSMLFGRKVKNEIRFANEGNSCQRVASISAILSPEYRLAEIHM